MRRTRIWLLVLAALGVFASRHNADSERAVVEHARAQIADSTPREVEADAPKLPRSLGDRAHGFDAIATSEPTTIEKSATFFPDFYSGAYDASNEPIASDEFPLATNSSAEKNELPTWSRWAKFPVGTWARMRTTSVSYENNKPVQSVTETRALLKSVDFEKKRYVLQYDSTIKMGAVDYARKSEVVQYDFWDVPVDDSTQEDELAPVVVMIGSKAIPCLTRRVVREFAKTRETTILWYSPTIAPYVLQRETTRKPTTDEGGMEHYSRELYVVQKTGSRSPYSVAPQNSIARSSSASGQRKQSTTSVLSSSVPGGIIRETTLETRLTDNPTAYQTTTVLLDYYVAR